jgi:hypothetical protein
VAAHGNAAITNDWYQAVLDEFTRVGLTSHDNDNRETKC